MQPIPFFKDATPREIRVMRLCVAANIAVISCCAFYLARHFAAAGLGLPSLAAALLAGYFVADFSSGAVHWVIDTWLDERALGRGIAITREHHTHPDHVDGYSFLEYASLGSAPSAVFFGAAFAVTALFPVSATTYTLMILWLVSSVCLLFGMSFHNLAHKPARSSIMRLAQRLHLVCPPAHHWVHHHNHTIHYCVVNGWANYVCDGLHVWRGLERVIQAVTGLVPRADEAEWQRNFRETGVLAGPRRSQQAASAPSPRLLSAAARLRAKADAGSGWGEGLFDPRALNSRRHRALPLSRNSRFAQISTSPRDERGEV